MPKKNVMGNELRRASHYVFAHNTCSLTTITLHNSTLSALPHISQTT